MDTGGGLQLTGAWDWERQLALLGKPGCVGPCSWETPGPEANCLLYGEWRPQGLARSLRVAVAACVVPGRPVSVLDKGKG